MAQTLDDPETEHKQTTGGDSSHRGYSPADIRNRENNAAAGKIGSVGLKDGEERGGFAPSLVGSPGDTGKTRPRDYIKKDALGDGTTGAAADSIPFNPKDRGTKFAQRTANFFLGTRARKRNTIAGSAIGLLMAGVGTFGFFSLGADEYIQIAHLLEQFHFATLQNESDDRTSKLVRDIRYRVKGEAYKTNMNYIGNKMADRVEAKLNAEGLKSTYTTYFGLKEGYFIDRSSPLYKNKDFNQIKQAVQDKYGSKIQVVQDADSRIRIVQPTGYRAALNLTKVTMQDAGYSRVTSSISAHIMGVRDGVTLHPLRKLDAKYQTQAEKFIEWSKEKVANIKNGVTDAQLAAEADPNKKAGKGAEQQAGDASGQAKDILGEANSAGTAVDNGNSTLIDALTSKLTLKLTLGGASAASVLCLARGIVSNAGAIKEAQVILPVTRMGMRSISEGDQIEYGKSDIDPQQQALDSKQLYDSKTKTSWYDAQSIQAELGHPNTGVPPDSTLLNINNGTPFDFVNAGALGSALNGVCSTAGQAVTTVVSFLGGPVSALASLVVGAAIGPPIISALAHWLAGDAANIAAAGADFGNIINFGAFLGSIDQAVTSAMPAITGAQAGLLGSINSDQAQAEFEQHDLAYRLFSPTDSRSLFASVMDRQSPVLSTDVTGATLGVLNIGHSFMGMVSTIFGGITHAGTENYSYGGVAEHAFTVADMDSPLVQHPYANGDVVAGILSGPQGPGYITRAQNCWGDSLTQTVDPAGDNVWDVEYGTSPVNLFSPQRKAIDASCNDMSDPNWLRISFFIFDTQNLKALACYEGDAQSCTDLGFSNGN